MQLRIGYQGAGGRCVWEGGGQTCNGSDQLADSLHLLVATGELDSEGDTAELDAEETASEHATFALETASSSTRERCELNSLKDQDAHLLFSLSLISEMNLFEIDDLK